MRSILHWDGDCFFASIEQACDARLRDRPVVVGGDKRGVVLSVSRQAAALHLRPGMPTARIKRLCPQVVILPPHYALYEQFGQRIVDVCEESTPLVETSSVGSAWLDLTGCRTFLRHSDPLSAAQSFQKTIRDWLKLSLSVGLATNKTVARIAARLRKPAALLAIGPGQERDFLAPLPLRHLSGIGPQTQSMLELAGLRTIGQLAHAPIDGLQLALGRLKNWTPKETLLLLRRAQGLDEEPVRPPAQSPSLPKERIEFSNDQWEEPILLQQLAAATDRLCATLRGLPGETRQLTLLLQYADHDEAQKTLTLPEPTALEGMFYPLLPDLLRRCWQRRVRIRSLTLRTGAVFRPSPQAQLFDDAVPAKQMALATALDRLRARYGQQVVQRAARLPEQGNPEVA